MEVDLYKNEGAGGPIILWLNYGSYEGWKPYSFDTIDEALHVGKFGNEFIITRQVTYTIIEEDT